MKLERNPLCARGISLPFFLSLPLPPPSVSFSFSLYWDDEALLLLAVL